MAYWLSNFRLLFAFAVGILLTATVAQAQTRKIAHRSHGGDPNTFAMLMDDDHGGGPAIEPRFRTEKYDLDPFIAKIRAHYEHVARQSVKGGEAKADGSDSKSDPTPKEGAAPEAKPSKTKHRSKSTRREEPSPGAATPEVPRFRLAKASAASETNSNGNLWLLAAVILACVAPGVVWLSGSRRKQG